MLQSLFFLPVKLFECFGIPALVLHKIHCTTTTFQRIPTLFKDFADHITFQKDSSKDSELTGEELLPQAEADKIEAMLQDLKVSLFQ